MPRRWCTRVLARQRRTVGGPAYRRIVTFDVDDLGAAGLTLRDLMLKQTPAANYFADIVGPRNSFSALVTKSMPQSALFADLVKLKVFDVGVKPEWAKLAKLAQPKFSVMPEFVKLAAGPKVSAAQWATLKPKISVMPDGLADVIAGKALLNTTKTAAFAAVVARQWESGAMSLAPIPVPTPSALALPATAKKARPLPQLTLRQALTVIELGASLLQIAMFLETPDLRHAMCLAGVLMIAAAATYLTQG
jgi:hypothetical protein